MSMMQLKKYAKPYLGLILLSVTLLFAQAMAEITLPDYLSKIVNVGIMQGGVDELAPEQMSTQTMVDASFFIDPSDIDTVLNSYELIDGNSEDYEKYLEKIPTLETQPVYILKDIDLENLEELEGILQKPLIMTYMMGALASNHSNIPVNTTTGIPLFILPDNVTTTATFINHILYEGLNMSGTVIGGPTGLAFLSKVFLSGFEELGDTMLNQIVSQSILAEYGKLGMDMEKFQNNYMFQIGIIMILLTLASMVCTIAVGYTAAKVAVGMSTNIREELFKKVEGFANKEFDKFSTASLITRTTNDITQIQMVIFMVVRMVLYAPILGAGGIYRALNTAPSMWWIIGGGILIMLFVILFVFRAAIPRFKKIQDLTDDLNLVSRENLTGMMVVRAFNMQEFEKQRFEKVNNELTNTSLFINRLMSTMMPAMMFVMTGMMVLVIWIGGKEVNNATIQVGDMMAFISYAMLTMMAFIMISMMFIMIPRAAVSGTRIAEVLDTEASINDSEDPSTIPNKSQCTVEFKDVCFRYPAAEEYVLHNISFTAKYGETTAIIGSTGSGKTTLVNLIPRFYDVTKGSVSINGKDVRDVTQHDVREVIGYVPQTTYLFSGTIESNLKYANENADQLLLNKSIDIAQARILIDSKEEGIQAEISQGGANLSGGQKQRMSIARAIVKQPPIYILDDSFSALDFKTDAKLRKAFKQESGSSTLIIVSQRVSTIRNAEQILVLEHGKLVGKGTHEELMKNCNVYADIALSQNTEDELK